ncbi:MAG: type II and III secretion system protein family protein, partial [Planctomycetes bacterium]|nr:type II and III secretion system protein family protein [Planctomycetota bacterium]
IPLTANPTLSLGFPRAGLQFFIRAIADNNLASILAEPNMVVISGETASFLAGGEFPILVPQGNDRVTIEFKQFGVLLNFTPIVRAHQTIRLRVAPEISEKDFSTVVQIGGLVVPGVKSRSVETTVELASGQTIAIAGLLSEEMRGAASRVPGIGDVPILGALFRSVQYQRGVTELIILVTPEIVAPLDAHQIGPLPTDGVFQPSDTELYALGLLEGMADAGDAARGLEGDPDKLESEPGELSLHGSWGHAKPGDPQ